MDHIICRNCDSVFQGAFCSSCGAKARSHPIRDSVEATIPKPVLTLLNAVPLSLTYRRLAARIRDGSIGIKQGFQVYAAAITMVAAYAKAAESSNERLSVYGEWWYTPATMLVQIPFFYLVHVFLGSKSDIVEYKRPLTAWLYTSSTGVVLSVGIAYLFFKAGEPLPQGAGNLFFTGTLVLATAGVRRVYECVTSRVVTFLFLFFFLALLPKIALIVLGALVASIWLLLSSF